MSVRITGRERVQALFDSTTGRAFAPVFSDVSSAQEFLVWLAEKEKAEETFLYYQEELYYLADPRIYRADELAHIHALWYELREAEGDPV